MKRRLSPEVRLYCWIIGLTTWICCLLYYRNQ